MHNKHRKFNKGFTLIELMLVVVVLAILAAIAYPSYVDQIRKARRSDAKQALLDVAAKMEVYYQDNKAYPSTGAGDDITVLGYASSPFLSIEDYYNVSFVSSSTTAYTIQAVPVAPQDADTDCATFRLNGLGVKTVTGPRGADRCW